MRTELFEEMLEKAKDENLAEFIAEILYNKPSENGDKNMIGLFDNYVFVKIETENQNNFYEIYDCIGELIISLEDFGFINGYSNEDYALNYNILSSLVDKVLILIDADKVIYI
jgi:hypothetical protein